MSDVLIEFWTYDAGKCEKKRLAVLLVHEAGGFDIVEGMLSGRLERELRTEPLPAAPTSWRDWLQPERPTVLPKDGLAWARAVILRFRGRDFWASEPRSDSASA